MAEDFNTLKNALIADNKATADKKAREDDQRYREEDKKLDDLISEQKNFYTLTDKNGKKVNDGRTIQSKLTKSALDNQILNMQETKALRNDIKETRSKEKKDLDINKSVFFEHTALLLKREGKKVSFILIN